MGRRGQDRAGGRRAERRWQWWGPLKTNGTQYRGVTGT